MKLKLDADHDINKGSRSLWHDLTISLIVLVVVISFLTSIVIFSLLFYQSKHQAEQTSDEYINYLRDALETHLWNMDRDSISKICTSFMENDTVERLIIKDYKGTVLFQEIREDTEGLKKTVRITYKNLYMGSMELALSSRIYRDTIKKLLLAITITMTAVIIGIALGTRIILRQLLQKPLDSLIERIQKISAGEYTNQSGDYKRKEIKSILFNFNRMAEEIEKREKTLLLTNKQLSVEIDERLRIEKENAKQKAEFEAIFFSITDAVIYTDTMKRIVMVNPAFTKLFGYSVEETIGKLIDSILDYPDLFKGKDIANDRTNNQLNQSVHDVEYQRNDGSSFHGDTLAAQVFDSDGEVIGFACVIRDISDRKFAEKEKESMESQLRQAQKMEAIGTLAGGIAHDFNNILSAIIGYAELVQDHLPPESSEFEMQGQVLQAGFRAKELVQQILLFSRQVDHEPKPVLPHLILKEALTLLRSLIPSSIEIQQTIATDCGSILADPTQLHQIIMNLGTNAYHAMSESGGILAFSLSKVNVSVDDISFHDQELAPGDYVRLEVSDTGCGMDEETREKIFNPYFTTKPAGEGTGLGLSVVLGIIKSHGGRISVYSEPGKGTTVKIYFPGIDRKGTPKEAHTKKTLPGGNERILLVDDEMQILAMTTKSLENLGYEVVAFSNSLDALEYMNGNVNDIDLVITDMTMPHMNGLKLAKQLFKRRPDLPVILCTGFSDLITKDKIHESGIKEYLSKPVLRADLSNAIRKIFDKDSSGGDDC